MVNTNKTYYTVFKNITTNFNINNLNFVLDNNPITYKITFKYLGIIFDNNLSFKHHIDYLVNKLYKIKSKIYFLKKTYKLNTKTLLCLYYSLFYPHINYCNTVWACNYKSNIKKIQTLQNLTTRTIFNYPFDKHINYKDLEILNIININILHILIFSFKHINNLLSDSFSNFFNTKTYNYNIGNNNNLIIEKYRANKKKLSLKIKGAKCWNQLPDNLKSIKSLKLFKTLLKNIF